MGLLSPNLGKIILSIQKDGGKKMSQQIGAQPPIIQIKNLCKKYQTGGEQVTALDHVNLTVQKGNFAAIIGRSGSGKSTLMNILGCLDTPKEGDYFLDGKSVKSLNEKQLSHLRSRSLGFVFQSFYLLPTLSALQNVALPLKYMGLPKQQRQAQSLSALAEVGLSDRVNHLPNELSGGQQQRVAIARAIVGKPPIILADEPTGNLDATASTQVMAILQKLWQQGHTLIVITHDEQIARLAPTVLQMENGVLKPVTTSS